MQKQEKLGVGVAVLFIGGLFGALVLTRPAASDSPAPQVAATSESLGVDEKVRVISKGDEVAIEPLLRPGVRTVVEFTADW